MPLLKKQRGAFPQFSRTIYCGKVIICLHLKKWTRWSPVWMWAWNHSSSWWHWESFSIFLQKDTFPVRWLLWYFILFQSDSDWKLNIVFQDNLFWIKTICGVKILQLYTYFLQFYFSEGKLYALKVRVQINSYRLTYQFSFC